ncbi:hypothetical protein V9T40_004583 [Parthenolecanium corni]|uniref:Uncharacterized protein n=1 Tax=Parthenolecanium corni TaxID=536013 RepID=A0AAN9YB48_9HEMI
MVEIFDQHSLSSRQVSKKLGALHSVRPAVHITPEHFLPNHQAEFAVFGEKMKRISRARVESSRLAGHDDGEFATIFFGNGATSTFRNLIWTRATYVSCPVLSSPILSYPILSYPVLSCSVLYFPQKRRAGSIPCPPCIRGGVTRLRIGCGAVRCGAVRCGVGPGDQQFIVYTYALKSLVIIPVSVPFGHKHAGDCTRASHRAPKVCTPAPRHPGTSAPRIFARANDQKTRIAAPVSASAAPRIRSAPADMTAAAPLPATASSVASKFNDRRWALLMGRAALRIKFGNNCGRRVALYSCYTRTRIYSYNNGPKLGSPRRPSAAASSRKKEERRLRDAACTVTYTLRNASAISFFLVFAFAFAFDDTTRANCARVETWPEYQSAETNKQTSYLSVRRIPHMALFALFFEQTMTENEKNKNKKRTR